MNNPGTNEAYPAPLPSARLVEIAAKWAKAAHLIEEFNFFSDLSRCGGDSQILVDDAALSIARRGARDKLAGEDEDLAREAREIVEWADSIAEMRRAGAAPTWSLPKVTMTLEGWIKM